MQVSEAAFLQGGLEIAAAIPRVPAPGVVPHVNHRLDAMVLKSLDEIARSLALVADGEDGQHFEFLTV